MIHDFKIFILNQGLSFNLQNISLILRLFTSDFSLVENFNKLKTNTNSIKPSSTTSLTF